MKAAFYGVFIAVAVATACHARAAATTRGLRLTRRPCRPGGVGFAMRSPNVCLQSSRCASTQPRRFVLQARVPPYYIKFRYCEKATKFEIISHFF
jgi:hypothetical protein